jgi:hypothetical protein
MSTPETSSGQDPDTVLSGELLRGQVHNITTIVRERGDPLDASTNLSSLWRNGPTLAALTLALPLLVDFSPMEEGLSDLKSYPLYAAVLGIISSYVYKKGSVKNEKNIVFAEEIQQELRDYLGERVDLIRYFGAKRYKHLLLRWYGTDKENGDISNLDVASRLRHLVTFARASGIYHIGMDTAVLTRIATDGDMEAFRLDQEGKLKKERKSPLSQYGIERHNIISYHKGGSPVTVESVPERYTLVSSLDQCEALIERLSEGKTDIFDRLVEIIDPRGKGIGAYTVWKGLVARHSDDPEIVAQLSQSRQRLLGVLGSRISEILDTDDGGDGSHSIRHSIAGGRIRSYGTDSQTGIVTVRPVVRLPGIRHGEDPEDFAKKVLSANLRTAYDRGITKRDALVALYELVRRGRSLGQIQSSEGKDQDDQVTHSDGDKTLTFYQRMQLQPPNTYRAGLTRSRAGRRGRDVAEGEEMIRYKTKLPLRVMIPLSIAAVSLFAGSDLNLSYPQSYIKQNDQKVESFETNQWDRLAASWEKHFGDGDALGDRGNPDYIYPNYSGAKDNPLMQNVELFKVTPYGNNDPSGYWFASVDNAFSLKDEPAYPFVDGGVTTSEVDAKRDKVETTNFPKASDTIAFTVTTSYFGSGMKLPVPSGYQIVAARITDPEHTNAPQMLIYFDSNTGLWSGDISSEGIRSISKRAKLEYFLTRSDDPKYRIHASTDGMVDSDGNHITEQDRLVVLSALGLSSDATEAQISEAIRKKKYSRTPIADSGRKPHEHISPSALNSAAQMAQEYASFPSEICSTATWIDLVAGGEGNMAGGYSVDSDGSLNVGNMHAWVVDKNGVITDPTPAGGGTGGDLPVQTPEMVLDADREIMLAALSLLVIAGVMKRKKIGSGLRSMTKSLNSRMQSLREQNLRGEGITVSTSIGPVDVTAELSR